MAATCEHCGFRTTEVKSGGAIGPKGRRIELKITDIEDLSRDVLKVVTVGPVPAPRPCPRPNRSVSLALAP